MTVTSTFTCDGCGPVEVTMQVPDGTTCADLAADLERIEFESHVTHELSLHLDGLAS